MTTVKEATFRHQFLTTDKVEVLLAQLHHLKALNLSQNKMNMLPRGIPSSLIALDLSYNLFATFPSSEKLHNLLELKLSNNSIESTSGLTSAVSLQYLDLSHNRIKAIEGLEGMKNLKSLQLEGNLISSPSALRSLSFNRNLLDLVLERNPLALLRNYKVIVKGFVLSLQKLDGERCKNLVKNGGASYADGYKRRNTADMSDCDSKITKSSLSIDTQSVKNDCSMYDANGESIYIDGWSSNTTNGEIDLCVPARTRSPVPWRNPPSLLPRDRKGNSIFGAAGECIMNDSTTSISRRFSSVDSSPIRRRSHSTHSTPGRGSENIARGFYGSPGKGTPKSADHKTRAEHSRSEREYSAVHQWSTPLLAKDAALKRIQSEERIIRKLCTPRGSGPVRHSPAVPSRAVQSLLDDASVLSDRPRTLKKELSHSQGERGRTRERDSDTFYASDRSRDRSGSPPKSRSPPHSLEKDKEQREHSFEQDREASYLNKHLGISTAEELWHDELIEEAISLSSKSHGLKGNGSGSASVATTTEGVESVSLSPTLQTKSSVLRAVFTAEAIRKRNLLEKDEQTRRRSPSPVRRNTIDWDHHTSGGKTPPYHRSNFFKISHSESERNAEMEAERDYKSVLSRSAYMEDLNDSINLKRKEFNRAASADLFETVTYLSRHSPSTNTEVAPLPFGKLSDSHQSTYRPLSPPQLRPMSPVQKRTPSPPRLRPHSPVQSRPHSPSPDKLAKSPPLLRPTSPPRSQSPPRLHYHSSPHISVQDRPHSPPPLGRPHSPPQLRPSSPIRAQSPPRLNPHSIAQYYASSPTQKRSPSPDRLHYHKSHLLNLPVPPHGRARSPVQIRAQSPPPPLRPQSPISRIRSDSFESLDNIDVGNHSRSPTQNKVPVLNKGKALSGLKTLGPHSPASYLSARTDNSGLSTRTTSPRYPTEIAQLRRKQIYESALLLHENPRPDDFFGDFKYLERLLTEAGDGSIEVRRLKTVMRTIMESRKESLQLLQSSISTSPSA